MKPELFMPPVIERVLEAGAALAVSISGGADSQALARALTAAHRERGWPGKIFLIYANLGRAEWPETLGHVEHISRETGLSLEVVRRAQGDLVAQWQDRQRQLAGTGTPFWSSRGQRYCTSGQKRDQINRALRRYALVISAEGIRAEESTERKEKQPLSVREKITAERLKHLDPEKAWMEWQAAHQAGLWQESDQPGLQAEQDGGRLALTWYPLFHWTKEDVFQECGTSSEELEHCRALYQSGQGEEAGKRWPCHPCYYYGASRCGCALCVLGSRPDLEIGAKHNPDLLRMLAGMEQESDCSFKRGFWLSSLLPAEQEGEDAI